MIKVFKLIIAAVLFIACKGNNGSSGSEEQQNNSSIPKTLSDSLYKAAMEGHNVGMAKMGEIIRYQKLVKQKIDSAAVLKLKKPALDSVMQGLNYAEELMNRWMHDFDPDKAGNSEAEKVIFYNKEKVKIDTVNARIFKSIENAKRLVD